MLKTSISSWNATSLTYGAEEDDQRLMVLIKRIKNQLGGQNRPPSLIGALKAHEVDKASDHFPPCFTRTHRTLRTHNRLGHHARIAYTLFLKEIGLPLEEALKFWSLHYSKVPETSHHNGQKCAHSWQENSKKFEYSINHMYGNAGGRKNYSAHTCASIAQRSSSINEELTCPFIGEEDIEDLAKDPTEKCLEHFRKNNVESVKSMVSIVKPSHYFRLSAAVDNRLKRSPKSV